METVTGTGPPSAVVVVVVSAGHAPQSAEHEEQVSGSWHWPSPQTLGGGAALPMAENKINTKSNRTIATCTLSTSYFIGRKEEIALIKYIVGFLFKNKRDRLSLIYR